MDVARTDPILIWGPNGSGTSLYLTALVCWLGTDRLTPKLALLPESDEAVRWVTARARATADGLDVGPRPTAAPRAYDFRLYQIAPRPAHASGDVSRPIAPVRCWSGLPSADAPPASFQHDLHRARGVVVLVDDRAALRGSAVAHTIALLSGTPRAGAIPVAACLTSTDLTPDAARRDAAQWLAERDPEGARALAARAEGGAAFKVSSLGYTPRRHGEREILHSEPAPRGVIDPLRWILARSVAA